MTTSLDNHQCDTNVPIASGVGLLVDDLEISGSVDPAPNGGRKRRLPVNRMVGWLRRANVPTGRIVIGSSIAAVGNLVGLPWLVSVPVALGLVLLPRRMRLLRPDHRRQGIRRSAGLAALVLIVATSWSYTGYLTAPGVAPVGVRTADWMRDHYMSPLVDQLEQWLYGRNGPTNGAVGIDQLPNVAVGLAASDAFGVTTPTSTTIATPPAPVSPASVQHVVPPTVSGVMAGLDGEGIWAPNTRSADGAPVTFTTFLRPDPAHNDVVAAAVWFDPSTTKLVYAPGTKEPGSTGWAWNSAIPQSVRPDLVAAFNSGFKFKDSGSGMFTEGQTPYPLIDGQASLAIYADGHSDIGTWGTQLTMSPDMVSVRQNLEMIVQDGKPVDGLTTSIKGEWGKQRKWQIGYTLRSGIGITADGALIYVAGSNLTTQTLADALARVGSVRAMELDIHAKHPTFNFFVPDPTVAAGVQGTKLLPEMTRPVDRYLLPDQRDFFALVLR